MIGNWGRTGGQTSHGLQYECGAFGLLRGRQCVPTLRYVHTRAPDVISEVVTVTGSVRGLSLGKVTPLTGLIRWEGRTLRWMVPLRGYSLGNRVVGEVSPLRGRGVLSGSFPKRLWVLKVNW